MKIIVIIALVLLVPGVRAQAFTNADYEKEEVYITMRDGVRLFTSIYRPVGATEDLPVIIKRTPYSIAPYGEQLILSAGKKFSIPE